MFFYVQQSEVDKESSRRRTILDLPSLDDSLQVERTAGHGNQGVGSNKQASMFRLESPAKGHGLKEGSWYELDPKVFRDMGFRPVRSTEAGGMFLRGEFIAGDNLPTAELTSPIKAQLPVVASPALGGETAETGNIVLSVVNCGHGNWNEILTDDLRLIYDTGASRSYTWARIRSLVRSRKIAEEERRVVVFISHWDIDHYQALLAFTNRDLAKIDAVYAPTQLPDTATFKRVRDRLSQNKVRFEALEPAGQASGKHTITLSQISSQGPFRVFRATPGRSRNQTGIVIGVEGAKKVGLLTGDHHYEKVLQAAKALYPKKPCILVTPHHGGRAGQPSAANWLGVFQSLETPISCGTNSYGHPYDDVLDELTKMQGGVAPWQAANAKLNDSWDVFL